MSMTYKFRNLEQLGAFFDSHANNARSIAATASVLEFLRGESVGVKALAKREAYCWSTAASIVRMTKLDDDTPFNPPVLEPDMSRLRTLEEFHDV